MKTSWKKLRNALWSDRPLRQKLAIGVWLSVLPLSLLTSLIALQQARRDVLNRLSQQLPRDSAEVNAWLSDWQQLHSKAMELAARFPSMQELKLKAEPESLRYYRKIHPLFSYAITDKNGTTLFTNGALLSPLPRSSRDLAQNKTSTIAKALKGASSNAPLTSPYSSAPCMATSVPIYAANSDNQSITGTLTSCIPMSLIGNKTEVDTLIRYSAEDNGAKISALDINAHKPTGYALLAVLPDQGGSIILSYSDRDGNQAINPRNLFLRPEQYPKSAWAPFIKSTQNLKNPDKFQKIRVDNENFYVGFNRSKDGRSVLVVLNEGAAFATLNQFF